MRPALLQMLRCPSCRSPLTAEAFTTGETPNEVRDGVLRCACGMSYPVVNTIPRMLPDAYELFADFRTQYRERLGRPSSTNAWWQDADHHPSLVRTRNSFGYQWTVFSEMSCDFRENFWNYLNDATPTLLQNKVGLDVGCGFGRHLYQAAHHCSMIVGVDLSQAIDAAYKNTQHLPNAHLVQGNIYALPFAEASFDFLYSLGVLHHLPDPLLGLQRLVPLLRPSGLCFVWLYSKRRRLVNAMLECVRTVTTRLPYPLVRHLAFVGALIDQKMFVGPYRALHRLSLAGPLLERLTPPRIKVYNAYPFQVLHADWFDRLSAPVRHYYHGHEVQALMARAGLSEVQVSPTGLYGWRACGVRQSEKMVPGRKT